MLRQRADPQPHAAQAVEMRISSPPAMLMKPGASPHCGTNAARAPRASALTAA